jgi:2-methylcitrate dehydratase PrpD
VNETVELARWIRRLKYSDIPQNVVEKAKIHILDDLGCQLGGSIQESNKALLRYVRSQGGVPECTIVNYGDKTSVFNAVLTNGSFGHGWDFDDQCIPGGTHQESQCTSAVMAMAEKLLLDGRQIITAFVAGYETMARIGDAAEPGHQGDRGFHSVGTISPFAGAAIGSKALGLDDWETENALAVAASQCGGTFQHSQTTGGAVKRCHSGFGASNGVRSALLAKEGLTGAREILEGKKGWMLAYSGRYDLSKVTTDFGTFWYLTTYAAIKSYSCCSAQYVILDTVYKLKKDHNIQAGDVEEVVIKCDPIPLWMVGTIQVPAEGDIFGAQFSARWGVAMAFIVGDNRIRAYQNNVPPYGKSRELAEFVKRVRMELDKEAKPIQPGAHPARIAIKLRNGKTVEGRTDLPKGWPENPLTHEELLSKFKGQACLVIPEDKQNKIIDVVQHLEYQDDIRSLMRNLIA